jgi:hypothetical protein
MGRSQDVMTKEHNLGICSRNTEIELILRCDKAVIIFGHIRMARLFHEKVSHTAVLRAPTRDVLLFELLFQYLFSCFKRRINEIT